MPADKQAVRRDIEAALETMKQRNAARSAALTDRCVLTDYAQLTTEKEGRTVWTAALQAALDAHEVVVIPAAREPYYIDATVTVPSHRRIEAYGATLCLVPDCEVLMLRNRSTADGSFAPVSGQPDCDITVLGGRFEESRTARAGYGSTGRYTAEAGDDRPFYGVSTCLLFNHIEGLTLRDMTFAHTAGFAVQLGDACDVCIEDIAFDACYADGLHINGNCENLLIRRICGEVGDDLVALNMYDWRNSSVNFGPMRCVLCEQVVPADTSHYKAFRILPGVYTYADGSTVDCGLYGAVIRDVRGVRTFKMYLQTPPYRIGEAPERGAVGSADDVFFEDIDINLSAPIDPFPEYTGSDPVRGVFAAFEVGADIGYMRLDRMRVTLHPEQYPLSCVCAVGPKSVRWGDTEVFDPYLSCRVECISFGDVRVNGAPVSQEAVRCVAFDNINGDGNSTACGAVDRIEC